jgi:iron complex outermembrane receptor protein
MILKDRVIQGRDEPAWYSTGRENMRKLLANSAICASLSFLVAAPGAFAQTQESASSPAVLDDIVVTARKRTESLQDVPASIQVVGAAQIKALNVSSLSDLNGATPNASIGANGGPNAGSITIRGISSNTRNAGFEAGAALYVDGIYQGRPAGNDQDLVDIERVEVLRGPQGTLYGKNTTAGAFNLTTVSPGDTWTGKGFVRFGSRELVQVAAYAAGPLVENVLGAKISVYKRVQDGYQKDVNTGEVYGNTDAYGMRGQLRFTPGGWTFDLRGDYFNDKGNATQQEPMSGPAVIPGIDTIASNIKSVRTAKGGGASLTASHDVGIGEISSISAWRTLKTYSVTDDDFYVVAPIFGTVSHRWADKAQQFSQELRLVSNSDGPLNYVFGLYYFNQVIKANRPFDIFGLTDVFFDKVRIDTDSYAAFVNADYKITEQLTFTAGLRYTTETKRLDFEQKGFAPTGYPTIPRSFDKFTDSDLSPTASLRYSFSPDISIYATVSRGFKAGGWNPDITKRTTTDGIYFDAEKVTNYEAGLRTQFLDRRLTINITGYHMDYGNLQISQFLGTDGFVITNAGKAVIDGAEVEVIARASDWFSLRAGGAYNDAHYTKFDSSPPGGIGSGAGLVSYAGQQFTNAPKFEAYVAGDVTAPITDTLNLVAHADYRYQSKVYFDDARTVRAGFAYSRDGFGLLNARVGVQTDSGLEVSLYGQNLTNKRVLVTRASDVLTASMVVDNYGAPREFGVRVGVSF